MNLGIDTSVIQQFQSNAKIMQCYAGSTKIIGRRLSRENRAAFAKFQVRFLMYTQTNDRGPPNIANIRIN